MLLKSSLMNPRATLALTLVAPCISLAVLTAFPVGAEELKTLTVAVHAVNTDGVGAKLGTLTLSDTPEGLKIAPQLSGLIAGSHGMHIHQNPSCEPGEDNGERKAAFKAGPHYDPDSSGQHAGPHGAGHRGDLPVLTVSAQGESHEAVIAPRLKLSEVVNRSLIIHEGGDTYSEPPKLGGGGARVACAVLK